jgi:hypothetical protein
MSLTVEDLFGPISVEEVSKRIMTTEQELDPLTAEIQRSSSGVEALDLQGSGVAYRYQRIVGLGKAGVVRHVKPLGPRITEVHTAASYFSEARGYPSALESTLPGHDRMVGYLAEMRGNLAMEDTILAADKLNSVVASYLDRVLDSVALGIDLARIAKMHTPSSTTRHICTLASIVASGTPDGSEVSFIPAEGNEMLCTEGQSYQIYHTNGAGTTVGCRHNTTGADDPTIEAICIGVDPMTRRIKLKSRTGANIFKITGNTVASGDILVLRGELRGGMGIGSSPTGTPEAFGSNGIVDFLVNTGDLFGLSVDKYHRHKSYIISDLGGPWNEDDAARILRTYDRWHRKYPINRLYLTPGAILAHERTMKGLFTADRTGKPAKIKGGHVLMTYTHGGREVGYAPTDYMRSGYAVGMYMANGNLQMLVPPSPGDESGEARIGADIQFKRFGGGKGLFRPVSIAPPGGGPVMFSDLKEAPFVSRYNYMVVWHLAGIMVGGLQEIDLSL